MFFFPNKDLGTRVGEQLSTGKYFPPPKTEATLFFCLYPSSMMEGQGRLCLEMGLRKCALLFSSVSCSPGTVQVIVPWNKKFRNSVLISASFHLKGRYSKIKDLWSQPRRGGCLFLHRASIVKFKYFNNLHLPPSYIPCLCKEKSRVATCVA